MQKLLKKKGAITSLVKTGQEIAASADPSERRRIEGEVQALQDRYSNLNQKCADRMDLLEDAMKMAKEYADKLGPLEKWLDKTEKKVKEMETVPTEEDQKQREGNQRSVPDFSLENESDKFSNDAEINDLPSSFELPDCQSLATASQEVSTLVEMQASLSSDYGDGIEKDGDEEKNHNSEESKHT